MVNVVGDASIGSSSDSPTTAMGIFQSGHELSIDDVLSPDECEQVERSLSGSRSRSRTPPRRGRPTSVFLFDDMDDDDAQKSERARQLTCCWRWATSSDTFFTLTTSPDLLWSRRLKDDCVYVAWSLIWAPQSFWLPIKEPHVSILYKAEPKVEDWAASWMSAQEYIATRQSPTIVVKFQAWEKSWSLKIVETSELFVFLQEIMWRLQGALVDTLACPCDLHVSWIPI